MQRTRRPSSDSPPHNAAPNATIIRRQCGRRMQTEVPGIQVERPLEVCSEMLQLEETRIFLDKKGNKIIALSLATHIELRFVHVF